MFEINGSQVAFVGDLVKCDCPNGPHHIVTGDSGFLQAGAPIACIGDRSSCGANIDTGIDDHYFNGKGIAITGSRTTCGGRVRAIYVCTGATQDAPNV